MLDKKLRPTFTVSQINILAGIVDNEITAQFKNPVPSSQYVAKLVTIKNYIQDFISKQDKQVFLAQQIADHQQHARITRENNERAESLESNDDRGYQSNYMQQLNGLSEYVSPLDNPNLTDAQKADIISQKPKEQLTEAETKFSLDFTFKTMMAGMANSKPTLKDL